MKWYQFVIFFVIALSLLLLIHWAVYLFFISVFEIQSPEILLNFNILFAFLATSFAASTLISLRYNTFFTRFYYRISSVWMGFLLYFFLAALTYSLISLAGPEPILNVSGLILFFLAVICGIYGLINARVIRITTKKITIQNLPAFWHNRKAVWISDLHLGQLLGRKFAEKVLGGVSNLRPDIVFIGGDLFDSVKVDVQKMIEPLNKLKPELGVYFITGNHDGFTKKATIEFLAAIAGAGIKNLCNEKINIGGMQIIGVDYRDTANREQFSEILTQMNINKNEPSILLKHAPTGIDISEKFGISFQISGHTHKAQMQPLSFIPRLIYKGFDYGLKKSGSLQVYTSSGVGTWGPPLRVGTSSEIVLFEFQ